MPGRVLFNQQLKRHLQVPSFIVLLLDLCVKFLFLPPANEVWGKVMFLQVSVCPQLDFCMMSLPVWLTGLMFLPGVSLRESVKDNPPPTWTETPLYGDEWVVHILLECFIAFFFLSNSRKKFCEFLFY